MTLSEIKGEKAIDVLVDLLDPVNVILADPKVKETMRNGDLTRLEQIKILLKSHKKEIIQVMAILEDEDPEKYEPNLLSLPKKLIEIFNDPEIQVLFTSQMTTDEEDSSSSAMENTEEREN